MQFSMPIRRQSKKLFVDPPQEKKQKGKPGGHQWMRSGVDSICRFIEIRIEILSFELKSTWYTYPFTALLLLLIALNFSSRVGCSCEVYISGISPYI